MMDSLWSRTNKQEYQTRWLIVGEQKQSPFERRRVQINGWGFCVVLAVVRIYTEAGIHPGLRKEKYMERNICGKTWTGCGKTKSLLFLFEGSRASTSSCASVFCFVCF